MARMPKRQRMLRSTLLLAPLIAADSTPVVTTSVDVVGSSASTSAQWDISCHDGASLSGGVPYSGSFAAHSASECRLTMRDDGLGGFTWNGFTRSVTLLSGRESVLETFDVCSRLCCTGDVNGASVCQCRPLDGSSCITPQERNVTT